MDFDEETFKLKAEKEISRCRPGDWNHAKRVVEWVKKLGPGRDNLPLLISAAYIHDIGWRDIFSGEKISLEELQNLEGKANSNSEPFVREFLKHFDFDERDVGEILRLITAADTREASSEEEEIIVDADNLSKLSPEHIKEKFPEEDWKKMCSHWEKEFRKRIRTIQGKALYPSLLKKLEQELLPG